MVLPLLDSVRARLDSWFVHHKSQLADDPLEPLPRERRLALQRRIAALEVPTPLLDFVREALRRGGDGLALRSGGPQRDDPAQPAGGARGTGDRGGPGRLG